MGDVLFWVIIGQGMLLVLFGVMYATYPPKKINPIYGYRTKRTMANQKVWDYANKIGARMITQVGFVATALGAIVFWIYPNAYAVMVQAGVIVGGLILGLILCERDLNKHYDKHGRPKAKG